jgi:hypothetical protein
LDPGTKVETMVIHPIVYWITIVDSFFFKEFILV